MLDGVGRNPAGPVGDQYALRAVRDVALPFIVPLEQMLHDPGAPGVVQELGAAAYQQSEPAAETEPGEAESEPESGEEDGEENSEDVVEGDFRNE